MGVMKIRVLFIIAVASSFISANTLSGYFGYQDNFFTDNNSTKEKNKNNDEELLIKKALINPKLLTNKEFGIALEAAKNKAVMIQTDENIKNWIILNNFMIKNAGEFQKRQQIVLFKNPELDLSSGISKSGYASKARKQSELKLQNQLIKELTSKIVLIAFYGDAPVLEITSQDRVLWYIEQDFPKMIIKRVDVKNNKNLYEKLNEKITPSVWMAYKDNKNKPHFYRIAGGVTTKNKILNNIQFVYENIIKVEIEK